MQNNNGQNKKIKPEKVTIRISESISETVAEKILFENLELGTPLPPLEEIDQIDLLLTIDHSDKSEVEDAK